MKYELIVRPEPFSWPAEFVGYESFETEAFGQWQGETRGDDPNDIRWVQDSLNQLNGCGGAQRLAEFPEKARFAGGWGCGAGDEAGADRSQGKKIRSRWRAIAIGNVRSLGSGYRTRRLSW